VVSAGGRALYRRTRTGCGRAQAYAKIATVELKGGHYRTDIAEQAALAASPRKVDHNRG
jgi:phosphoribosylamine-glycine ligase